VSVGKTCCCVRRSVPRGHVFAIAGSGNDRTCDHRLRTVSSRRAFGVLVHRRSCPWNEAGDVATVIAVGVVDDDLTRFIEGLVLSNY